LRGVPGLNADPGGQAFSDKPASQSCLLARYTAAALRHRSPAAGRLVEHRMCSRWQLQNGSGIPGGQTHQSLHCGRPIEIVDERMSPIERSTEQFSSVTVSIIKARRSGRDGDKFHYSRPFLIAQRRSARSGRRDLSFAALGPSLRTTAFTISVIKAKLMKARGVTQARVG
jgi:hypothetical protein